MLFTLPFVPPLRLAPMMYVISNSWLWTEAIGLFNSRCRWRALVMNRFPMELTRWETGLLLEEFVAAMKTYQVDMRRRLREVELPTADRDYFSQIATMVRVLVMTEDWCGDSLMNVPILGRITEAAPGMELRFFIRSQSPELDAYYTARGITHIPVFSFLDANFHDIGTWVERPQAAHTAIGDWIAADPEVTKVMQDTEMTAERRHRALQEKFGSLSSEMEGWYADGLQAVTVQELKALLAPLIRAGPA